MTSADTGKRKLNTGDDLVEDQPLPPPPQPQRSQQPMLLFPAFRNYTLCWGVPADPSDNTPSHYAQVLQQCLKTAHADVDRVLTMLQDPSLPAFDKAELRVRLDRYLTVFKTLTDGIIEEKRAPGCDFCDEFGPPTLKCAVPQCERMTHAVCLNRRAVSYVGEHSERKRMVHHQPAAQVYLCLQHCQS